MSNRIVFKNSMVDIDIERTFSIYRVDSAMGKTYLPYAIRNVIGMPSIRPYSNVEDYARFVSSPWLEGDDVIYFFDRYDKLHTAEIEQVFISTYKSDRCVLVDVKQPTLILQLGIPYACVYIERPDVRRFIVRNGDLYRRQSLCN